jgi:hypothetical protein
MENEHLLPYTTTTHDDDNHEDNDDDAQNASNARRPIRQSRHLGRTR